MPVAKENTVLFVNHSMAMGGIETLIVDFVARLQASGVASRVAVFEGGGSLEHGLSANGVAVDRLGKREGVDLHMVARLRQVMTERRVRVVHSHNFSTWLYTTLAVRSLGKRRPIHVHTEHSNVEPSPRRYRLERWLARFTAHTVAVSEYVKNTMVGEIAIPASRVRVIYNGIDTIRFAPDPERRERVRSMLGIPADDVVIGVVARLAPIKDHANLLQALARMRVGAVRRLRLLVVGDGPERARLEAACATLHLSERVSFLGERRDTADLLNAFDIYALCSLNEGMNLTLLEAMSAGLPVVTTAVGGSPEIVADGDTGLLVPASQPDALAQALQRMVDIGDERREWGVRGRARVLARFSQDGMLRSYLQLYEPAA